MIHKKNTYLLAACCLLLLSFVLKPQEKTIELISSEKQFTAGESIVLQFKTEKKELQLVITTAWGTQVLKPVSHNIENQLDFKLINGINQTAGVLNWTLVEKPKVLLKGSLTIVADTAQVSKIESYLGPQRIAAGGKDYAQLTLLPTDHYDNPLPNETLINLNTAFETDQNSQKKNVEHFISWENIYSTRKSGRIFTAANKGEVTSKLQTIYVDANLATPFKIRYTRPNNYADSDQITTFNTDVIKDQYSNVIPDATLVNFVVKTSTGEVLQASGNTINGSAEIQIQHPATPQNWKVTAYITGIAQSDSVSVTYNPAITEIPAVWDSKKRILKVGPLNGMLGQKLPEGTVVTLTVINTSSSEKVLSKKTESGAVSFELKKDFYPAGDYSLKIEVLGVENYLESVKLL